MHLKKKATEKFKNCSESFENYLISSNSFNIALSLFIQPLPFSQFCNLLQGQRSIKIDGDTSSTALYYTLCNNRHRSFVSDKEWTFLILNILCVNLVPALPVHCSDGRKGFNCHKEEEGQ